MDDGENWKAWGVATVAVIISVASLFISAGSCGQQDKNSARMDHLEQRLDNLRDQPR